MQQDHFPVGRVGVPGEGVVVGVRRLEAVLGIIVDHVGDDGVPFRVPVALRRQVRALVEVEPAFRVERDIVLLDRVVRAADAQADPVQQVVVAAVAAHRVPVRVEDGDAGDVPEDFVVLDDAVVRAAVQHDADADGAGLVDADLADADVVVGPVVADDDMVAPLRGDDAVLAVVVISFLFSGAGGGIKMFAVEIPSFHLVDPVLPLPVFAQLLDFVLAQPGR